ncbi:glycosyltransferase [Thiorhodococcus mannitoliphagus]|uniref:Glycosyltransferase n=1 Tax=Thiorhodococcus mannitoliphagus TaxID=329406 RepID=A0A6P1DXF7_9GAMM|nr:glycosyltransferase family 2 protein [Thiorhodococcus mannitoliphagus]NEX20802.1 glycosyltransferase [Thiorhodococcus mannitoliphagus]
MNLSLITACYNSASTLGETLESVRFQRDVSLEYLLIDGGSSDGTCALIQREASRQLTVVSRWLSEPDDGIYDALNKGIHLATGDVVGFLHADDVFAHECVLQRVAACFEDPSVTACYGDLEYVWRNDSASVARYWRAGEFDVGRLRRGWMPPHPTLYVRRAWYEIHGGFDVSYKISADYDLVLRLLSSRPEKVIYLPEVLVRMRTGGLSNGSLGNILRKSAEDYRALRTNQIGGWGALVWKNLSKLGQFVSR